MEGFGEAGKLLVVIGIILIIAGLFLIFHGKIPLLGRLPGDIVVKRGNFTFFFPLTTMIIISVVVSLIFLLFRK